MEVLASVVVRGRIFTKNSPKAVWGLSSGEAWPKAAYLAIFLWWGNAHLVHRDKRTDDRAHLTDGRTHTRAR